MTEKTKIESRTIGRRQFIAGAGAVAITGAIAGLAACRAPTALAPVAPPTTAPVTPTPEKIEAVMISGLIVQDETVCAGCGTCELMCSLYHEGQQGRVVSRSELDRDPFEPEFVFNVCQQCRSPSCYFACPLKDLALCIDQETGATYVNQDECDGCGECIVACPFDPKRIELLPEKNVASVCDLCRGREQGPICVEYCPMKALTYVRKHERQA